MMSNQEEYSIYKNNLTAKKSKIIYACLVDYFLTFILTFILYVGVLTPINVALPITKTNIDGIYKSQEVLNQIVGSTRIQTYDEENNNLVDIEDDINKYLISLAKTSCYAYNKEYIYFENNEYISKPVEGEKISETFVNVKQGDVLYPNDNLSYFFVEFKSSHEELNNYEIDGKDYSNNKKDYLYLEMLDFDSYDSYFISQDEFDTLNVANKENITRYNILNETYLDDFINRIVYVENNTNGSQIYSDLSLCYQNAANKGVEQIENNYEVYIQASNQFIGYYNGYTISLIVVQILSFVLAFSILNILVPLCWKKKKTSLGCFFFKIVLIRNDNYSPRFINYLGLSLSKLIMYFSSVIIMQLFTGQFFVLTYGISSLNMFSFVIFSFVLDVISLILVFILKDHQLLSNLISNTIFKGKEDYASIKQD